MGKALDEDGALVDDGPDEPNEGESEFVEKDPTGRYGRYNEVLGKGAYKTVYKAFDVADGIEVAWNQVKVHDVLHRPGDMERLYSELHFLKNLKHKNIIKFYSSWIEVHSNNVNFITEIFTSGTLRQYTKKHRNVSLSAIKHWSRQILRGLVFLHSCDPPIIHRDLKCDNIFINGNNGEVKIGDLGLATILRRAPAAQSVIGTPEFMAPELYEEHYNELVDIYSFGMCLLEMLTSEYPYSECTNAAQIYRKVTMGKKPAVLGKVSDPETREFVEKCLASVSERLQARELLMDPFLRTSEGLTTLEPSHCTILSPFGDFRTLDSIPEDSHLRCIPSAQKLNEISKSSQVSSPGKYSGIGGVGTFEKPQAINSSSPNEGPKSSKDFRIKGRRQDDKKVLVRIRIASSGGEVRVIQFDFDVEADTAYSVANEMVTELDLSDQDVSTIADMIDSEIMALIPDWKPVLVLGLDEAVHDIGDDQKRPFEDNAESQEVRVDESPVVQTQDINVEHLDDPQSTSGAGLTYGRFEEVDCNAIRSDIQQENLGGLDYFSDFSSDSSGPDTSPAAGSSIGTGVNNDSAIQSLLSSDTDTKSDLLLSSVGKLSKNSELEERDAIEDNLVALGSAVRCDDSEVGRLIVQQKEELQILHTKHELALLDLKTRLAQNASASECKDLPRDTSTNEDVKSCGSLDRFLEDIRPRPIRPSKSEVCVGQVGVASGNHNSTRSLTGLSPEYTLAESSRTGESCHAGKASATLMTSSDIASVVAASGKHNSTGSSAGPSPEDTLAESEDTLAESRHTEGSSHAENPSATVMPSDLDSVFGARNALKASVVEASVSKSKSTFNEAALLDDCIKKAPTMRRGDANGAAAEVVGTALTDRVRNACPDKRVHTCPMSKPTKEPNGPESRQMPVGHEDTKPGLAALIRRESYLDLYKVSNNKDSASKSKSSELLAAAGDGASKTVDANQDQLKKQQLQKSIADLEAKTLENLSQSQSKYFVSSGVKKLSSVALQNGQQGATAKNLGGATIQSSQQVRNLPGSTIQNNQQGGPVKNVSGVTIQNGQQSAMVKNLSTATVQKGQQVVMKTQSGATLQNGQPGATSQNGQQNTAVKNLTGAPIQLGSTVKKHPGVNLQNGQQSATSKAVASQQTTARPQHMQTEISRA